MTMLGKIYSMLKDRRQIWLHLPNLFRAQDIELHAISLTQFPAERIPREDFVGRVKMQLADTADQVLGPSRLRQR